MKQLYNILLEKLFEYGLFLEIVKTNTVLDCGYL